MTVDPIHLMYILLNNKIKKKPVSHSIESENMVFNSLFKIIIYLKLIVKPMVCGWNEKREREKKNTEPKKTYTNSTVKR